MRRTLVIASLLVVLLAQAPAQAFYARGYFERPAMQGGAGKLYYTGSERERGFTCAACHVDGPGRLEARLDVTPPELLEGRYTPGAVYDIKVLLANETRGFDAQFNSNGFLAEFSAGRESSGSLLDGLGSELLANGRIVSSMNDKNGASEWAFTWKAPGPGSGDLVLSLGAVDGDGASDPSTSRQDHLNDDVFAAELTLREVGSTPMSAPLPASSSGGCTVSASGRAHTLGLFALSAFGLLARRRRGLRRR